MSSQENREDFENLFEHFPDEVGKNLSYIRERGLSAEISMRDLSKEIRAFLRQCKQGKLQGEEMNAKHQTIRNKYSELVKHLDLSVDITTNMENKVLRYMKLRHNHKQDSKKGRNGPETKAMAATAKGIPYSDTLSDQQRYCLCNGVSHGPMIACDHEGCPQQWFHFHCVNVTHAPEGKWYCPNCKKGRNGPGNTAMVATANLAINDTDDADGGLSEYWINPVTEKPANLATQNPVQATGGDKKKKKPSCIVTSELASSSVSGLAPSAPALSLFSPSWNAADMLPSVGIPSTGLCDLPGSDAVIGVSEPHTGTPSSDALSDQQRYCLCNGVSHGPMIACDHEGCPQQWFHFRCVNVTRAPKGKWHCPTCKLTILRQRSKRKN